MNEDYVSFETAKLLKEKGFDEVCIGFYTPQKELHFTLLEETNSMWLDDSISAPTLQMAMKWLREVHNLALNVCYLLGMWSYSVYRTDVSSSGFNSEDFDTYEEACEAGIRHCLENLI